MTEHNNCVLGAKNSVEIDNLKNSYIELNSKIDLIFDKLEQMRKEMLNRPPAWTTMALSILTGLVGFLGSQYLTLLKGGV